MRAVVTGQIGIDKKPYLEKVAELGGEQGKDVQLFNVGNMMYGEGPDIRSGRILDLPLSRLASLRRAAFKDIISSTTPVESYPANLIVMAPVPRAGEMAAALADQGIESRRLYNPPVHRHPAYLGYKCAEPMVHTERMSACSLSLPCHGAMRPEDVEEVVAVLGNVLR